MTDNLKLCESDYRFMTVIWENEPLPSSELVKLCAEKLGWKKSTTYTTLKKLCEKGFAENKETIVRSLVLQKEIQRYASDRFISGTFGGSLPSFLVSFFGSRKITEKEADEIKKLIDQYKES